VKFRLLPALFGDPAIAAIPETRRDSDAVAVPIGGNCPVGLLASDAAINPFRVVKSH
jgi:hypothetical protein